MLSWLFATYLELTKRTRRRRPLQLQALEAREVPANIFLTDAKVVNYYQSSAGLPIGARAAVEVNLGATALPAHAEYKLALSIDNVEVTTQTLTLGAGLIGTNNFATRIGDFLVRPGPHRVIVKLSALNFPDSNAFDNRESFITNANTYFQSEWAPGQKFTTPIAGTPFKHWTISNYVDLNNQTGGIADYRNKTRTYDGSNGLDFKIKGFAAMDNGVPVRAAADGIVSAAHDGAFDRNENGAPAAENYIEITHGNGWTTRYGNLRKNSVAVSVGDILKAGDMIGLVGSSGVSTGPHLNFVVTYDNRPIETYLAPSKYWVNPQPYAGDPPQSNAVLTNNVENHVTENSGFAPIVVARPLTGDRYLYSTDDSNATAKAGTDFVSVTSELVFGPGELFKNINIPISDDDLPEIRETFRVYYWQPDRPIAGEEQLTIVDDDRSFNFNETNGRLTLRGSELFKSVPTADTIAIDVAQSRLIATVNGEQRRLDADSVLKISIDSRTGSDTINIHATPSGSETLVYGGDHNDSINIGAGGSLNKVLGNVYVDGGPGDNILNVKDTVPSFAHGHMVLRKYNIDHQSVTRAGIGKIYYAGVATFAPIETLNLYTAASSDGFIVADSNPETRFTIFGGNGNDAIIGPNTAQSWYINGANRGVFNGLHLHFKDIENLSGGSGPDTFHFLSDSGLSGNLKGGAGADTLRYLRYTPVSTNLATRKTTSLGGTFTGLEAVVGGDHALDTLVGENVDQIWNIADADKYTVGSFSVNDFENLIGGSLADTFKFTNGTAITGKIDGAGGTDTLNYALYSSPLTIDLPNKKYPGVPSAKSIEAVVGGMALDRILGNGVSGGVSQWSITGSNAGRFTGPGVQMDFSAIENLTGYSNSDWFRFVAGGSISGQVDGSGGGDMLNYQSYSAPATVNLATNSATATGGIASIEWLTGSAAVDTLVATGAVNSWKIKAQNKGDLNATQFRFDSVENLNGGSQADTFVFGNGAGVSGVVEGAGGDDTLDYSAYTTNVQVDLTAGSATGAASVTNFENVFGGSGNDSLAGNGADNLLKGNAGDDVLTGLGGADILSGGWGEDTADGGDGRDFLLGGSGLDKLSGDGDDDLLIGGITAHDSNDPALRLLRSQWQRTDLNYVQRIALLRNTGIGGYLLNATTVTADAAAEKLYGGLQLDWFWSDQNDDTDAVGGESVN